VLLGGLLNGEVEEGGHVLQGGAPDLRHAGQGVPCGALGCLGAD